MSLRTAILHSLDPAAFFQAATGYRPDEWQVELLRSHAQQIALLCARQLGKSLCCGVYALWTAMYCPPSLILLLSPSLRQSTELFRTISTCYHRLGGTVPATAHTLLRLELLNGSRIISLPGTEATVRGYAAPSLTLIDESARVEDGLYYAIRPMRATLASGKLICLTTPNGMRGWFYDLWQGDDSFLKVKSTALDCPRISAEFLRQEQQSMPAYLYQQEYLCAWISDNLSVFSRELIEGLINPDIAPLFPGQRFLS